MAETFDKPNKDDALWTTHGRTRRVVARDYVL